MQTISIDIAKENLLTYQKSVLNSNDEVKIVSEYGNTFLISETDWNNYKKVLSTNNLISFYNDDKNNSKIIKDETNKKEYISENNLAQDKLQIINIIENLFEELNNEMINELNNEEDFNIELIDKIKNNYLSSKQHFLHFIDNFDSEYIVNNAPEYAIDNDGEIMLEWYGRIGARINLTFGKNGELYFISLVHGETTKSQLFINSFALDKIKNELTKLFNGKN